MRPGYVITANGVTLGLDHAVTNSIVTGDIQYAYTDLAPSGLLRGTQTAPDWQPATGRVTYSPNGQSPGNTYDLGPLVIDIGIPTGILTLPGYTGSDTFTGALVVNLLNSGSPVGGGSAGPKVYYTVNPSDKNNLMSATSVQFFSPLAGAYSQNMPPLSQQFFNTGRRVIAGMNYLYDAAGGYEGLYAPTDPQDTSPQAEAFRSAAGSFEPGYYPNYKIPGGVTNLTISNNTISGNGRKGGSGGNGVTVNGKTSTGNVMTGNTLYGNTGAGIALTNGGNGNQPTPVITSVSQIGNSTVRVSGTVAGAGGYTGPFQVQVYTNPASDAGNVQGRKLLGTVNTSSPEFVYEFPLSSTAPGSWITVLATPAAGAPNTSQFSAPVVVG
jgi:hypothetical protein